MESVCNDLNHNGSQDRGEGSIEGRTVYPDLDDNTRLDARETATSTDARFSNFSGPNDGDYKVRLQDTLGATMGTRTPASSVRFQA